jgi:hypothetical protein
LSKLPGEISNILYNAEQINLSRSEQWIVERIYKISKNTTTSDISEVVMNNNY